MYDLLQNHMSTRHTISAHAQELWDWNQTKIEASCHLERKVVTHDFKSDLPLVNAGLLLKNVLYWRVLALNVSNFLKKVPNISNICLVLFLWRLIFYDLERAWSFQSIWAFFKYVGMKNDWFGGKEFTCSQRNVDVFLALRYLGTLIV